VLKWASGVPIVGDFHYIGTQALEIITPCDRGRSSKYAIQSAMSLQGEDDAVALCRTAAKDGQAGRIGAQLGLARPRTL